MLNKNEIEAATNEKLMFELNRTQERVDELQRQACSLERLGLLDEARLRRDARAAGGRYLGMIERELERRKGK